MWMNDWMLFKKETSSHSWIEIYQAQPVPSSGTLSPERTLFQFTWWWRRQCLRIMDNDLNNKRHRPEAGQLFSQTWFSQRFTKPQDLTSEVHFLHLGSGSMLKTSPAAAKKTLQGKQCSQDDFYQLAMKFLFLFATTQLHNIHEKHEGRVPQW